MKINLIPIASIVLSLALTIPVYADHIYIGPEVEKVITYDENGNKVITLIFDPSKTPDFMKEPAEQINTDSQIVEKLPALSEAPKIGSVLGHILNENAPSNAIGASRFMEAYQSGRSGQCTWYAAGRFREIYGIELPAMGSAKNWIANAVKSDKIIAVTDIKDVPEQSIAVFEPTDDFKDWPGHVSFVEYVERDENGKPTKIFYTDANGIGDLKKDEFNDGYDGTVKAENFDEFKEPYGLKLIGFIVANET